MLPDVAARSIDMSSFALRVLAIAMLLGVGSAIADDTADTRELPRLDDAVVVHESPQTTIFTTKRTVEKAADELEALLILAGWQAYTDPDNRVTVDADARHVVLRKRATQVRARIAPAPAQDNATTVNYVIAPLRYDIPFPPDGRGIKFDPNRALLEAQTDLSFDAAAAFYITEMQTRGWTLHQPPDGSQPIAGDRASQRAFLTRDGQRPLLLFMRRLDGGATHVKLEMVSSRLLPGSEPKRTDPPAVITLPQESSDPIDKQVETIVGDALREVQKELRLTGSPGRLDRSAPIPSPSPQATLPTPTARAPSASADVRRTNRAARFEGEVKIPLPNDAAKVRTDAERGTVEFESRATMDALTSFFTSELPKSGWRLAPGGPRRDSMVGLIFEKEDKSMTVTVTRMRSTTRVFVDSETLKSELMPGTVSSGADTRRDAAAEPKLEAIDSGGLPVPKPNSSIGQIKSLFRYEAFALVPAQPATILEFYRKELSGRGWRETGKPNAAGGRTTATFRAPDGPAQLTLERKGNNTMATLAVRQEAEARKSGLLPKRGMTRILFGTMPDETATFTVSIDGRRLQLAPGIGQIGIGGPSVEVKAGTHRITISMPGKPDATDTAVVGAGEIWGLLIGVNGALPLQAY